MAFYLRQRSKRDEPRAASPKPTAKRGDVFLPHGSHSPTDSPHRHHKTAFSPRTHSSNPVNSELVAQLVNTFSKRSAASLTSILDASPDLVTTNHTCFSGLINCSRLVAESQVQFQSCTLLHAAVAHDWLDGVKILVARGADVDEQTSYNQFTPLHLAVADGKLPVLQLLLTAGASPFRAALWRHMGQSTWYRPQGLAEELGHEEAAGVLQESVGQVGNEEVPARVGATELRELCNLPDEAGDVYGFNSDDDEVDSPAAERVRTINKFLGRR